MENIEIITLEDGLNYCITDEIIINNTKYIFLAQEDEIDNICIKKINIIDNKEILVGLDSEEEFKYALLKFTEKHQVNQ